MWDSAVLGAWYSVSFESSLVEPFAYGSWGDLGDFGDLAGGVDFHGFSLVESGVGLFGFIYCVEPFVDVWV